jgi:hypothetical protein
VGREPLAMLTEYRSGNALGFDQTRPICSKAEVFFGHSAVAKRAGGVLAVGAALQVKSRYAQLVSA